MTTREKSFTFAARARMINLKCNFKTGQKDLKCRLCCKHEENQQGLLICEALRESQENNISNTYEDLYSQEKSKITKVAMTLREKYDKFMLYQVHGKSTDDNPCAAPQVLVNNFSNVSGDMD